MTHAHDADGAYGASWLYDYKQRAQVVQRELKVMFQKAVTREVLGEISTIQRKTASIRYLQRRRRTFSHRIVLFIYSSRFDPGFANELLGPAATKAVLPEGPTAQEIFERKAARLHEAFYGLVQAANTDAGHYVAAMMSHDRWSEMPLVWEVPTADPAQAEIPSNAMWWATFQYLCEISRAIVAFGGMTDALSDELSHIRGNPRLLRRLVWLDGDLNLYFPDRHEEQWPVQQLPAVLQKIDARTR